MGVEFFLFMTGYFLMVSIDNNKDANEKIGVEALIKTSNKFKRLMVYLVVAIFLKYCIFVPIFNTEDVSIFEKVYSFVSECLLLQMYVPIERLNTPVWYLSAILPLYPCFYYMLKKYRDFFANIFCTVVPIFIYSYIIINYGTLGLVLNPCWFTKVGVIRAIAGLCMGVCVYNLSTLVKKVIELENSIVLTLLEWGDVFLIFYLMMKPIQHTKLDIFVTILIFLLCVFICSQKTYTYSLCNKLKTPLWGNMSLALFFSHMEIAIAIYNGDFLPEKSFAVRSVCYVMVILIVAGGVIVISEGIKKVLARINWIKMFKL